MAHGSLLIAHCFSDAKILHGFLAIALSGFFWFLLVSSFCKVLIVREKKFSAEPSKIRARRLGNLTPTARQVRHDASHPLPLFPLNS